MQQIAGFIILCLIGCIFIGRGIYSLLSKKPMGFNLNLRFFVALDIKTVTDIKKYNRAVACLYIAYGVGWILLCVPMLLNIAWALFSMVGVLVLTVITLSIDSNFIVKKYRIKK